MSIVQKVRDLQVAYIGVASYGALGHTPPRGLDFQFQLFNLSGHFRAARTIKFDSTWLPIYSRNVLTYSFVTFFIARCTLVQSAVLR